MKKRTKIAIIVVAAIIAASTVAAFLTSSGDEIEVTTEKTKYGPLRSIVSASGNIVPHKAINISANVMGEIERIPVKEGDLVEKGDLLIVIDPEIYLAELKSVEAAMASADAGLALAKANYLRAAEIHDKKPSGAGESLISQEEYERLLADYRIAQSDWKRVKAQVESAKANLEKTSIYSSITGVVTSLNVEEGEVAVTGTMNNPGTVLMTVSDLSLMQAEVEVDETDIVDVATGQEAEVAVDAYPDTLFRGLVSEIGNSPIISNLGGGDEAIDFKVVIDLLDTPPDLKPGLSTTADIITERRDSTLYVAIQALTMRSIKRENTGDSSSSAVTGGEEQADKVEREGVFLVRDGLATFSPVKTGISDGMKIEIISGLSEGDEVITGSFRTIRSIKDSTSVKPVSTLRANGEKGERQQ